MNGSETKLDVSRTGDMISSGVLHDNGQLEPCSDDLPDNGFLHSETDPDTPSVPLGLEETDNNDFCHVDSDKYSSMPPIFDLDTSDLLGSACLDETPPNKSTGFS